MVKLHVDLVYNKFSCIISIILLYANLVSLYGDSAYTDYGLEDIALERKCVLLKIQRKSNAKKTATLEQKKEKLRMRKIVETTVATLKRCYQELYTKLH